MVEDRVGLDAANTPNEIRFLTAAWYLRHDAFFVEHGEDTVRAFLQKIHCVLIIWKVQWIPGDSFLGIPRDTDRESKLIFISSCARTLGTVSCCINVLDHTGHSGQQPFQPLQDSVWNVRNLGHSGQ